MATPSSSATSSASPPMSYLQANTIPPTSLTTSSSSSAGTEPAEREERKKAVQKFLARAEISMVTRGLRARLSYASYKATHNIPHIPLRDLEARSQAQSQSSSQLSQAATSRIIGAKRKAGGGGGNYYNNPATQGGPPAAATPAAAASSVSYTARGAGGRGTMAPPPPFSGTGTTSRTNYYPNAVPPPNRNAQQIQNQSQGQQGQSLYSSILAPPPAKQARTIHNPRDPPVPAPTRPPVTPKSHVRGGGGGGSWSGTGTGVKGLEGNDGHGGGRPRALSLVEGTRSHDPKGRKEVGTGLPEKKKRAGQKGTNKGKGKQKSTASLGRTDTLPAIDGEADADGDVDMDMKAAATLTSLLLQHHPHPHSHSQRPSMTASTQSLNATSPRSSLSNGSDDAASVQSGFSQFRQSSARIAGNNASAQTLSSQQTLPISHSHTLSADSSSFRSTTNNTTPPPPNHGKTASQSSIISDMNVTGTPRAKKAPTDSEAADLMLYLATSPSPVRPGTGRGRGEGPGPGVGGLRAKGRVLFAGGSKGDEGSFASSLGGGGYEGDDVSMDTESSLSMNIGEGGLEAVLVEPTVVPPTPTKLAPTPAQLLPPPPSPSVPTSSRSSGNTTPGAQHHHQRSLSNLSQSHSHSQSQSQSQTPTPSFNLTDFINVSPSPAGLGPGSGGSSMPKLGSSLRADVGRRLFEEEQGGRDGGLGGEPQQQQGGLGAGIDML